MGYSHHLNLFEREIIPKNQVLGKSIRATAAQIGRSPATVSRELRRNQLNGD
ncbi:helix-turn-helix domain-containing protein [Sporolactobacillus sp. KGMB 08714]|uniref:helix-turn-helix domain-containing protein n=1 Tax=Sporolactobacillus sp. KGMB 08714 TaxID=3064704 RepID=UPI003FA78BA4